MPAESVVMVLFLAMTLVLKKMSGPTEVKGLMYSCIIKLHACIILTSENCAFKVGIQELNLQYIANSLLPTHHLTRGGGGG